MDDEADEEDVDLHTMFLKPDSLLDWRQSLSLDEASDNAAFLPDALAIEEGEKTLTTDRCQIDHLDQNDDIAHGEASTPLDGEDSLIAINEQEKADQSLEGGDCAIRNEEHEGVDAQEADQAGARSQAILSDSVFSSLSNSISSFLNSDPGNILGFKDRKKVLKTFIWKKGLEKRHYLDINIGKVLLQQNYDFYRTMLSPAYEIF
jgi:hypothetical protein